MSGRWLELEQLLDRIDHLSSLASTAVSDDQTVAALLVDHVEEFEGPPIHRLVELEVGRPEVMWILNYMGSSHLPPEGHDRLHRRNMGRCAPSSRQYRCWGLALHYHLSGRCFDWVILSRIHLLIYVQQPTIGSVPTSYECCCSIYPGE